ncbi:hypothetical protein PR048_017319 [Dryococelus australis]|uniref:Reverse transcriptase/retrotransposon-derived protein RNase H-like domain-containing protein n=1 Tax=Dryococelus australis TaxID=614101 RepID=A0ABQ9H964_9NEOP|nr:hypothetical protein PR048_017319 [Dryococelus australis]
MVAVLGITLPPETHAMLKTQINPKSLDEVAFKECVDSLTKFLAPKNIVITMFFKLWQQTTELVTVYIAAVKLIAITCKYGDYFDALRDRLVSGMLLERMVRQLLAESEGLKFAEAVKIVMDMDAVAKSAALMSRAESGDVNVIVDPTCLRQLATEDVQYVSASRGRCQHLSQCGDFTHQPYREMANQNRALTKKKQEPQNACSCGVRIHQAAVQHRDGFVTTAAVWDILLRHAAMANDSSVLSLVCAYTSVIPVEQASVQIKSGPLQKKKLALLVRDAISIAARLAGPPTGQFTSVAMHVVGPSGVANQAEVLVDLKSKYTKAFSVVNYDRPISSFKVNINLKGSAIPVFHRAYDVPYVLVQNMNKAFYKLELVQKKADDIFNKFVGCQVFCPLDLTQAYLQLEVEEPSMEFLTINTINAGKIMATPAPEDTTQLKSYLSMLNYYKQFIPMCQICSDLFTTCYANMFHGSGCLECEIVFNKSETVLSEKALLVVFDPTKEIVLHVDSSGYEKGQHIPQADAMSRLPGTARVGVKECNFLYLTTPLVSPDEVALQTKD